VDPAGLVTMHLDGLPAEEIQDWTDWPDLSISARYGLLRWEAARWNRDQPLEEQ
jgi:hypothetical protein